MWPLALGEAYVDLVEVSEDRVINEILIRKKEHVCRSQLPRCIRHEMSLPVRTMGSWVRIPLKAWLSLCLSFVSVLPCIGIGLATG
jgi:hypothetical protein